MMMMMIDAFMISLMQLSHLKSLVLCKNNFSGTIPKELGDLDNLELLDLRENNFTGNIPSEIGRLLLLKQLLVHDNKIEGSDSLELGNMPSKPLFIDNYSSPLTSLFHCKHRKFAHCLWYRDLKQLNKVDSLAVPIKGALKRYFNAMALPFSARRKLLDQSSNLAAASYSGPAIQISYLPITISSGSFPAVPDANKKQNQSAAPLDSPTVSPQDIQISQPTSASGPPSKLWKYIIIISGVVFLVLFIVLVLCIYRKRAAKVIKPWKTGISGQLQSYVYSA